MLPVDIHTVDSNNPFGLVNSSNVHPADVRKPIPSVNSNKTVRAVNSNKPVNSKNVRPADTRKPVCHVNSSTLVRFTISKLRNKTKRFLRFYLVK